MKSKLSTNQWIAVVVSISAVVFIFFISAQNSNRVIPTGASESSSERLPIIGGLDQKNIFQNIMTQNTPEDSTDLMIEDLVIGEGKTAEVGNKVLVHYDGYLTDETLFDSSYRRGMPFEFVLGAGEVISGWDNGVVGMKEGGLRILVIPPALAYGEREVGPIPPNSTLVFTVELIEVLE